MDCSKINNWIPLFMDSSPLIHAPHLASAPTAPAYSLTISCRQAKKKGRKTGKWLTDGVRGMSQQA